MYDYLNAKIAKGFVAKAPQRENAKCAKALTRMSLCPLFAVIFYYGDLSNIPRFL